MNKKSTAKYFHMCFFFDEKKKKKLDNKHNKCDPIKKTKTYVNKFFCFSSNLKNKYLVQLIHVHEKLA
jgi:hypothetical protein